MRCTRKSIFVLVCAPARCALGRAPRNDRGCDRRRAAPALSARARRQTSCSKNMNGAPLPVVADSDLSPLARIHAASFAEAWTEAALRNMLKKPRTWAFSTQDGFVMTRVAADEAEILTLAVAPDARGR